MQPTNFWQQLQMPFSVLAPMDDVTDGVFRQIVVKAGKPDVLFTEFTNCDGLVSRGKDKVMQRLKYQPNEHPIVAQIWGATPKNFYKVAQIVADLGFDGIDINMGCPVKKITKKSACSGLIKNPELAKEIIQATQKGSKGLPVSIKTRLGITVPIIQEWIRILFEQNISALTIHLRTVTELSKVPAHWELMSSIVELKNKIAPQTILIGNGDVMTLEEGEQKCQEYGIDGVMYGRAIFSDPWLFNKEIDKKNITPTQQLELYLQHIRLFQQTWEKKKHFGVLKRFCKIYIHNIENASEIREKVMLTKTIEEMENVVQGFLFERS